MSTPIIYRQLDTVGEPRYGQGLADYISGIDATAQSIRTKLRLLQGEWWEDQQDGLPLFQRILGNPDGRKIVNVATLLVVSRILEAPNVVRVISVSSSWDAANRAVKFYCVAQTRFGFVVVQNYPTPPSRALPNFGGF